MVTDRASGFSKGFGFVRYGSLEDAAAGIEGMDGKVSLDYLGLVFVFKKKQHHVWCPIIQQYILAPFTLTDG